MCLYLFSYVKVKNMFFNNLIIFLFNSANIGVFVIFLNVSFNMEEINYQFLKENTFFVIL